MADALYAAQPSSFWENYQKGRATPPASFWNYIYEYHAAHSGCFATAFDLGAGIGTHSKALAQRFPRVIIGDPGPGNIEIARQVLSPTSVLGSDKDPYDYHVCAAENSSLPDSSVDLVFMANALHWADIELSVRNISRMLKPGGTFAAAQFGIAYFEDPTVRSLFNRLLVYGANQSIQPPADESLVKVVFRATEALNSGYDSAAIPAELFQDGVERVKINVQGKEKPFVFIKGEGSWEVMVTRVGSKDQAVEIENADWDFDWDLEELKQHYATYPFSKGNDEFLENTWKELAVAGRNGRYKGVWPVTLLLATRKRN